MVFEILVNCKFARKSLEVIPTCFDLLDHYQGLFYTETILIRENKLDQNLDWLIWQFGPQNLSNYWPELLTNLNGVFKFVNNLTNLLALHTKAL